MMNILGCLDTVTGGQYILNGKDVSRMGEDELADVRNTEIGFVFQQFNLLPRLTAWENVALPLIYAGVNKKDREERARAMLDKVGLKERGTPQTQRTQRRPEPARGNSQGRFINNPSIILADEPTGNLDSKTSVEIMETVRTDTAAG